VKVRLLVIVALLLAAGAVAIRLVRSPERQADAVSVTEALRCDVNQRHDGFRIAQIRAGGNSLEAYRRVPTCFAESDFQQTPSGAIISAHDEELTGNCGKVSQSTPQLLKKCRMANGDHLASLSDFLRVPLTEWFIDLKASISDNDAAVVRAVKTAVDEIRAAGRSQGAVLMLYRAPQEAVELVRAGHVRAAMKGYPDTVEGTRQLVREASKNGFEMVCVNIAVIDKSLVEYARGLGVWLLAWETGRKPPPNWRELAEAGLGGLITGRTEFAAVKIQQPPR
jgi:hypothetical protein